MLYYVGDWNITFLYKNTKLQDLQHLLIMFSPFNTVVSPTRASWDSNSLTDIMTIDKINDDNLIKNIDFG
jgi:hypothetical protein